MTPRQRDAIDRAVARERKKEAQEKAKDAKHRAWVRAHPEKALKLLKRRLADRKRNLKDPNWGDTRRFPRYNGQTLEQYVRVFQAMNHVGNNALTFTTTEPTT